MGAATVCALLSRICFALPCVALALLFTGTGRKLAKQVVGTMSASDSGPSSLWRLHPVESSKSAITISTHSAPFELGRTLIGPEFEYVSRLQACLHRDGDGAVLESCSRQNKNYTGYRARGSSEWRWLGYGDTHPLRHGDSIALDSRLTAGSVFTFEQIGGAASSSSATQSAAESVSLGCKRPRATEQADGRLPCGDPRRAAAGLPKFDSGCSRPCCVTGGGKDSEDEEENEDEEEEAREERRPEVPRSDKAERIRPPSGAKKRPHHAWKAWQHSRHKLGRAHGIALADKWEADDDLTGFIAMEKYDGHRAIWRPKYGAFVSRKGTRTKPPPSFAELLPTDLELDGELWAGRGQFMKASSLVKATDEASWTQLKYVVYDAPSAAGSFIERITRARTALPGTPSDTVYVTETWPCEDKPTMDELLEKVMQVDAEGKCGEGLILRRGSSMFRAGVSDERDMLKVKPMADAEALIIPKVTDNQKSSVRVRMLNGDAVDKELNVTTTAVETKPPGTVVTLIYQHGLDNGMPRHAHIKMKHEYTCDCAACDGWRKEKMRHPGRGRASES